jgi:hypothetical protein
VTNRIHKTLEGANIKLASVATNVIGVSGRAMVTALVNGQTDPAGLARLARGRMQRKQLELGGALLGRVGPQLAFWIDSYNTRIAWHLRVLRCADDSHPPGPGRGRIYGQPGHL